MNEPTDFELGEEIEVARKPHAGAVISVRLSPQEAAALRKLAREQRSTLSAVARQALTALLTPYKPPVVSTGWQYAGYGSNIKVYARSSPTAVGSAKQLAVLAGK